MKSKEVKRNEARQRQADHIERLKRSLADTKSHRPSKTRDEAITRIEQHIEKCTTVFHRMLPEHLR